MMKKLASLLAALVLVICIIPGTVFAQSDYEEKINHCTFVDPFEHIDADYSEEINSRLNQFYENTGIETCILVFDYISGEKTQEDAIAQAEQISSALYSDDENSLTLFINNDNGIDVVYGTGKGLFYSQSEDFLNELDEYWAENRAAGNFGACVVDFAIVADTFSQDAESWWQTASPEEITEAPAETESPAAEKEYEGSIKNDLTGGIVVSSNKMAYIVDESRYFTSRERDRLITQAEEYTLHTGLNIVIAVSDDVGSDKSDSGVVDYADLMYEKYCGINTDGVLFLINNDTKYDYISTSGSGINYYSDVRIESILDSTYDYLVDEDFYNAATVFISRAKSYYDVGKANYQTEVMGMEFDPEGFGTIILFVGIIAFVIGFIIFAAISGSYKLQKAVNSIYVVQGSKIFQQATDTFAGVITNRIYSPRSSGGSGGGRSGHSSTHHPSGGGRHGGGGRHR